MTRRAGSAVLGLISLLALAAPASASSVTIVRVERSGTASFDEYLPCLNTGAGITLDYKAVSHVTARGFDEHGAPILPYHLTLTQVGSFVADPFAATLPVYRGRFSQSFTANSNTRSFASTFSFSIVARGADGSRLTFHETGHFTANAAGGFSAVFDHVRCA